MSAAASFPTPPSGPPGALKGDPRPNGFNNTGGGEKAYDHIQDLQARAQDGYDPDQPVAKLLSVAQQSIQQARFLIDARRPDLAYVEYLRSYEIAVTVLPKHGTVHDLDTEQTKQYRKIMGELNAMNTQFMGIKGIIENNNKRSGVLPKNYQVLSGHARSQSESQREYAMKAPYPQSNGGNSTMNGLGVRNGGTPPKVKPSVSPKPESLHGRALSQASGRPNGNDALNDRFARLRMASGGGGDPGRPSSRGSNASIQSSPVTMPTAADYNGRTSFDALTKSNTISGRPQGPRGMPNGGPSIPAKLPLDTQFATSMPKAPSPTYSPARNMQTTGNIAPPRHSARSLASNDVRRTSGTMTPSSASARAPNGSRDSGDYFPSTAPDGAILGSAPRLRRASAQGPRQTRCSAERLFDYIPRYTVLLIDVRSRAEFDQGHIFSSSCMCVEPMSLRQGMSAEQLAESLVLSPDGEPEMFDNRHEFDLVVYYDGDTQSEGYLDGPQTEREAKLKYLHEALWDYNQEKPLREAPMLLIGGIDAWTDLVGQQALQQSNTLSKVKLGRPLQRRPAVTAHGSSSFRLPKRRVQDFAPLGQDEEKAWLERARQESVSAPQPPVIEETDGDGSAEEEQGRAAAIESFNQLQESFNQRFPDPSAIDMQSGFMRDQLPRRTPPVPPAKVPAYPTAPSPSQYPQAPTRPAPAAPRMSYTGVSDRAVSQNTPTGRSDGMVPYIPPKLRPHSMTLPRTGLINFGVTCYMNSILQALSATTPLTALFLQDDFKRSKQANWKGSKGVLPELYSNLMRSLWKGDVSSIKPTTFKNFCGRLNASWTGAAQQDAKEFFDFLVETLHQDLNTNWNKSILRELTPAQEAAREQMPKFLASKREWSRYLHREYSSVSELFGGQTMSHLRCLTCGFVSTTWEFFTSISVEIPPSGSATLAQCLSQFCREEKISGAEAWRCPRCKEFRDATKRITITRAPTYLVIHFKRFSISGYNNDLRKVHTVIDFPLRNFSLDPWMLPPPQPSEQKRIQHSALPEELRPELSMTPPYTYDAYAVLKHIGSNITSGHYTTAAKDRAKGRERWMLYNDTQVLGLDPERGGRDRLQDREAYIVFYERVAPEDGVGGGGRL